MTRILDTLHVVLDDVIKHDGKEIKQFINIYKE